MRGPRAIGAAALLACALASCAGEGAGVRDGEAVSTIDGPAGPFGFAEVRVSPAEATSADRFTLTIEAGVEEGYDVEVVGGLGLPARWEADELGVDRSDGVVRRRWELTPFVPGEAAIGPIELRAVRGVGDGSVEPAGAGDSVMVPGVSVAVRSVFASEEEVALDPLRPELAKPIEVPWLVVAGVAAGAAVAALAIGAVAVKAVERSRRPVETTPDAIAHRWIEELRGSSLVRSGNHAVVLERLADILRRYVELRLAEPALEMTTRELASTVSHEFGKTEADTVRTLLNEIDLVKFARVRAVGEAVDPAFAAVAGFVERTRSDAVVVLTHRASGEIVGREEREA